MSLYYEAAKFLVPSHEQSGSLKSRVFNSKDLKSQPKQIYALVAEASKWSPILSEVITQSKLLQQERKLSPDISLLLVHDLLLSKSGIAAPASHPLRVAVTRHKARLSAELTKIRIKRGFSSLDELRTHLAPAAGDHAAEGLRKDTAHSKAKRWPHPRWVRINTLNVRQTEPFRTLNPDYEVVKSLGEVLNASPGEKILYMDEHVPHLIALPPDTDVSKLNGYGNGSFIVQDKASCFPAYLLDPRPEDGPCLDACAAPGNKTTHLVAILHGHDRLKASKPQVWACERDKARAEILKKMVHLAGCDDMVSVKAGHDFLQLDPHKPPWNSVGSLLLDPSCSGSGMIDRDESIVVTLPSGRSDDKDGTASRKRKRKAITEIKNKPKVEDKTNTTEQKATSLDNEDVELSSRLRALSAFQLRLLLHSFGFPNARKISYSTCSIHAEENEHVVIAALKSEEAKEHGWRLLTRDDQVEGMKSWHRRGDIDACRDVLPGDHSLNSEDIAEACIRCEAGTEEGTQGFFVAAFSRALDYIGYASELAGLNGDRNEPSVVPEIGAGGMMALEEWEGFSDSD
ncbi:MAG: hypothetical protein LQ350_003443 [Teloschistes chrysophthalmus]|nr:MAG: hypothetical protein LQ350_003443 [Niorma chrysophthalma]